MTGKMGDPAPSLKGRTILEPQMTQMSQIEHDKGSIAHIRLIVNSQYCSHIGGLARVSPRGHACLSPRFK